MEKNKENKQQMVYRVLKARIVERVYAPGQRIVIDQIAKELATSSIPVREAIRQLEAEGLVEYERNVGPVVRPINEEDYYENLKVLAVLEGYASALGIPSITEERIGELREKNERMKEALEEFDFRSYSGFNIDFHRMIYEGCGNGALITMISQLQGKLDAIRGAGSTLYSGRVKTAIDEHEGIIRLLETKASFKEVEEAVRQHKWKTAEDFERRRSKGQP